MTKHKFSKLYTVLLSFAIIIAGLFSFTFPSSADNNSLIGGGYAVTNQTENVYFMPILYNSASGLPTSEANCVLASTNGYIYIGGYGGITKYDSVNFEKLSPEFGLTSGRGLFEDSMHRIWVATNDNGVVIIDGNTQYHFTKEDGLPSNSIRTFAEDTDNNIFIGTTSGISYIDKSLNIHKIDDERINTERILRLVSDANGVIYGYAASGSVFNVSTKGIDKFFGNSVLTVEKITTIMVNPEESGKIYYGTDSGYVYYGDFGKKAKELKKYDVSPIENVHWMHFACDRVWVLSTHEIGYLDENGNCIILNNLPIKDSYEMIMSDYQGNIWAASSRYGVMKIVSSNFLDVTAAAGLIQGAVNTTCFKNNLLYVGTDAGLEIIDENFKPVENELTEYFKGVRIRQIMKDKSGNLWFSTFSSSLGLVRVDSSNNTINFTVTTGLPSNDVRCSYETASGDILVGTNAGIAIISNKKVSKTYTSASGLQNEMILTICEDSEGKIYAGTDGDGIYVIEDDNIERIGMSEGLGSDVIMRLRKDSARDLIWVITSNTVEYIKYGHITKVNTFPYNNNFDVIENNKHELWFLSSDGLYVMNADDVLNNNIQNYKHYDVSNGLNSTPILYSYSGAKGSILYIAGNAGVTAVDINNFNDFTTDVSVSVRSIICDKEEIFPNENGVYEIPAKTIRIQIMPAVLDYTLSDPTVKMYLDDDIKNGIITEQSRLTSLEFTNLKYGSHTLHIQIIDNNTGRTLKNKTFNLYKKPTFFERTAVRILIAILVLLAISVIVWRILTGTVIRKQYLQVQDARNEAIRANSAKNKFLANMSNEILTPVNVIIGMNDMILREDTTNVPEEYSEPIKEHAKNVKDASQSLLALLNDLFDISKIETGKISLIEQDYNTEKFLMNIILPFRKKAEEKKLYFKLDIDETLPRVLYGDNKKIKQIISNILSNAVKYTDMGGFKLSVKVVEKNEVDVSLRFSVKDTGIGIKKENLDKLFYTYEMLDDVDSLDIQGIGLGLDISRQYAELMNGKLWCESKYGEGSEFILTITQKISDNTEIGQFSEEKLKNISLDYMPQFIAPDADVLVVSNSNESLEIIKGLLKPTEMFITTSKTLEDAFEKVVRSNFNMILLNFKMCKQDNFETLAKIKELNPSVPVYAIVVSTETNEREFYKSKGFDGYFSETIDITALENTIMKYLPENIVERINGRR